MKRDKTPHPGIYRYEDLRGKVRYQVRYRIGLGASATEHAKTFPTMRAAQDFQAGRRREPSASTYDPRRARTPISVFFPIMMRLAGPDERKSRSNYEANFRNHVLPCWGHLGLDQVGPEDVAELLAVVREKPRRTKTEGVATAHQVYRLVFRIFSTAVELRYLPPFHPNPAVGQEPKRPEPRHDPALEPWAVELLAAGVHPMYRALIYVLAYVGLRLGEAGALTAADLDIAGGWISVRRAVKEEGAHRFVGTTKDNEPRRALLLPEVSRALQEHMRAFPPGSPTAPLFTSLKGRPFRPSNFRKHFQDACEAVGLEPTPTPHSLRATAASLLARAGVPEVYIQESLGHGSKAMTERYIRKYQPAHEENRKKFADFLRTQLEDAAIPDNVRHLIRRPAS